LCLSSSPANRHSHAPTDIIINMTTAIFLRIGVYPPSPPLNRVLVVKTLST
jgi:hypothetical protein